MTRYVNLGFVLVACCGASVLLADDSYKYRSPRTSDIAAAATEINLRAEFRTNSAIARKGAECEISIAPHLVDYDSLFNYIFCRNAIVAGDKVVLSISSTTLSSRASDANSSSNFIFEVPADAIGKVTTLPAEEVLVFYSDCRHSWLRKTGCSLSESASGTIELKSNTGKDVSKISIDIELFMRPVVPASGKYMVSDRLLPHRIRLNVVEVSKNN